MINTNAIPPSADAPLRPPNAYDWPVAYEAETFIRDQMDRFLQRNSVARNLAGRMKAESGTDLFEWIDHIVLSESQKTAILELGFTSQPAEGAPGGIIFEHPLATLPRIALSPVTNNAITLALRPEFVADFAARHNLGNSIEGEPCSRYRQIIVSDETGASLKAVERRAYRGFSMEKLYGGDLKAIMRAREFWKTRRRHFTNDAEGFAQAREVLTESINLVGRDASCQFFFEAERAYWESRNRAARIQKYRQDILGLGWGNHDHHTFRASREHFVDLIDFLLKLGFQKRERYYAGAEAGWGAQICEQTVTGIVVFADVDLLPAETHIDFSTQKLPPSPKLGTVGLWVALHGESFLQAGMHHLEARFEFDCLRDQLQEAGINMMKPFSDFDFLRQAFTEGERWRIQPERLTKLLASGLITQEQFKQFSQNGAIGSHLENLQRHGGFKGFNQKSVSVVIAATDPRRSHFQGKPLAA